MSKVMVCDIVDIADSWKQTGAAPVSTRWVEVVKKNGDSDTMVRCRTVGRDLKPKDDRDRDDLVEAMPLLEAKRSLTRFAATLKLRSRRYDKSELRSSTPARFHLPCLFHRPCTYSSISFDSSEKYLSLVP